MSPTFNYTHPGEFTPVDPQNWNRYVYVQNNPLKFIDPEGKDLYLTGTDADYIVAEFEQFSGLKLKRDPKTGKVTIDRKGSRKTKGTSKELAEKLKQVISDSNAEVKIKAEPEQPHPGQPGIVFDSFEDHQLDTDDYKVFKRDAPEYAAASLGHVLEEYYQEQVQPGHGIWSSDESFNRAHKAALRFEGKVLSDLTAQKQGKGGQRPLSGGLGATMIFNNVSYDIYIKTGVGDVVNVDRVVRRNEGRRK